MLRDVGGVSNAAAEPPDSKGSCRFALGGGGFPSAHPSVGMTTETDTKNNSNNSDFAAWLEVEIEGRSFVAALLCMTAKGG
jgi:hypothetical protein